MLAMSVSHRKEVTVFKPTKMRHSNPTILIHFMRVGRWSACFCRKSEFGDAIREHLFRVRRIVRKVGNFFGLSFFQGSILLGRFGDRDYLGNGFLQICLLGNNRFSMPIRLWLVNRLLDVSDSSSLLQELLPLVHIRTLTRRQSSLRHLNLVSNLRKLRLPWFHPFDQVVEIWLWSFGLL